MSLPPPCRKPHIIPNSHSTEVNTLILYIRTHLRMSPNLLFGVVADVFLYNVSSILIFVSLHFARVSAACHLTHNGLKRMSFGERCHILHYNSCHPHSRLIDPMDQSLGNMCMMRDNNGPVIAVLNLSRFLLGRKKTACAVCANKQKAFIKCKKTQASFDLSHDEVPSQNKHKDWMLTSPQCWWQ